MTTGVTALLGPTNTGKTHFAIERMLAHPSGMIGLPLRLLAREVYQKLVSRAGANAVGANHKRDNERQMPRRAGIANARTYSTLNEAYQKIRDGGDGPQLDMMRGVMRLSNAALR